MIYISDANGYAIESIVYATTKAAELSANRKLSDKQVKSDRVSHIKPKTWKEKGYKISYGIPGSLNKEITTWNPGIKIGEKTRFGYVV